MVNQIFYGISKLLEKKIKNDHYIPFRVSKGQKYVQYCRYYNEYWNMCFKVQSCHYNGNELESVYVKSDDGNYQLFSTDLVSSDYLLVRDDLKLYKRKIINTNRSYRGAEIIYWFYCNNITCFNPKYRGFWKYLDPTSAHRISDYNHYYIIGIEDENGIYTDCKIIKDPMYTYRLQKISRDH